MVVAAMKVGLVMHELGFWAREEFKFSFVNKNMVAAINAWPVGEYMH
jgi:hypothetical protein